jgi:SAM-dependent methyltransferase
MELLSVSGRCRVLKTDAWNEAAGRGIADVIQAAHEVILLEVSPGIANAAASLGYKVVLGSIELIPFPDESFDAVLDISTSDHLPEDRLAGIVGEYARILRPVGRLLFIHNSSSSKSWMVLRKLGINSPAYGGVPPVYYFAPASVQQILERYFVIESKRCTSVCGWAKPLLNRIPPRNWAVEPLASVELRLPWWILAIVGRQAVFFCRKR